MNQRIGIIGCGNMGGAMVAHMRRSGLEVACFDRDAENCARMSALGASLSASAQDLAQACDVVILSLPTSMIVEAVMAEIGPHLGQGAVVLDTSTSVPATSQAMSIWGKKKGFAFVDGPVSGGPAAAGSGTMTMLLAGDDAAIERVRPVLDVLTAKTIFVGGSGAGHAAKIANNMLCAANLVLVAEAVKLGEASGVRAENLLEGINAGSGRSGVSEVNFPKWILNEGFDSGFTMGLMRKDVRLALELARETGVEMDGFEGVADIWLTGSGDIADGADFNEITTRGGKEQGHD